MTAQIIDILATGAALREIERRTELVLKRIGSANFDAAEVEIGFLRHMTFRPGVIARAKQEARRAADAVTAELAVRRREFESEMRTFAGFVSPGDAS